MLPELFETDAATSMLTCPFVVQLVDHQNTVLIAQLDELTAIGIMTGTYVVDAKLFHQLQALLNGPRIGGSTQCP